MPETEADKGNILKITRRQYLQSTAALAVGAMTGSLLPVSAFAQSREKTLRHVMGATISSLDPTLQGATRESFPISMSIYDRLATFGKTEVPGGFKFDMSVIKGELAETIDESPDKTKFTFHLRKNAVWHDNSPVTAEDVKWSLDRAMSAQSLSKAQMANGSMLTPEQVKVVGDGVVEIQVERPDRLTLATLCVPFIPMFNSKLAKKHATADDPWAIGWLKENTAAGGAYVVETNRPGQQLILKRNDKWKSSADGQLPYFEKVITQTIPDASSRTNLMERGDADITLDAAPSDINGIKQRGKVDIFSIAQTNAFQCVSFNTLEAPFNDPNVRKAVAYALPYDDMFRAAQFGRGEALFGADPKAPIKPEFLQALPNRLDLDSAREALKKSGSSSGFKTSFSFPASLAATVEPMAALIKESLAKISIDVSVQKLPDAQFTTMLVGRKLPMFFDFGTSWLPSPDYMTRVFFLGNGRWNSSGWDDAKTAKLAEAARFTLDDAAYDRDIVQIVERVRDAQPVALLWHPSQDVLLGKTVKGYTYWYHRGVDYRDLKRA